MEGLNPRVALLSAIAGDYEGLPSPEMIEAVQEYTLLRTERDGWIELTTDGEQKRVEVERKKFLAYRSGGLFTRADRAGSGSRRGRLRKGWPAQLCSHLPRSPAPRPAP